jgi:RNA polymerase sigma-70 factor (ECF subfamily)
MSKSSLGKQFSDYVIKYKENHYRLAYSYVHNADDALDIVQESIYKAIASIDSLKNPDYMKTWFYRILVNTSIDLIRKQKKAVIVDEEILSSYDSGAVDNYQDIDLQRALDSLPDNYRNAIVLRYFEDLKIEEVAEILNENVNTVKTRLYKSLEMLRIKMNVDCKED